MRETRNGREVVLRRAWEMGFSHDTSADPEHAILFSFQDRTCRIEVGFDVDTAEVLAKSLKAAILKFEEWACNR